MVIKVRGERVEDKGLQMVESDKKGRQGVKCRIRGRVDGIAEGGDMVLTSDPLLPLPSRALTLDLAI